MHVITFFSTYLSLKQSSFSVKHRTVASSLKRRPSLWIRKLLQILTSFDHFYSSIYESSCISVTYRKTIMRIYIYIPYIYPDIHTHMSGDLRKGSLRHSSNYYIRDIWKMPKMTKFLMLLYYHEHVSLVWCHQSSKCIWLYLKCCKLPVVMATIRPLHLQWLIMKSESLQLPIIRLRKHKRIHFHFHLHYNIDTHANYIIFVRCLYWVKNNQHAPGDQHSDVILGLTFFLTSHSKPNYICCFKLPYIRQYWK